MPNERSAITQLLQQWSDGDRTAMERVVPLVYDELRLIARAYVQREGHRQQIQTTELVHEAFLRLSGERKHHWKDRVHFYGVAAKIMRRVLVDLSRREGAKKRGSTMVRVTLSERNEPATQDDFDFLALDRVLKRLETLDPRQVEIVELRFFADLSVEDAAQALGISPATVKREWAIAKAWLLRELDRQAGSS